MRGAVRSWSAGRPDRARHQPRSLRAAEHVGDFAAALRASVDPASVRLPGIPLASSPGATATSTRTRHDTQVFGPRPPKPLPSAQQPDRRRRLVPVAIGAAAVVGLVGLVSWARKDDPAGLVRTRGPALRSRSSTWRVATSGSRSTSTATAARSRSPGTDACSRRGFHPDEPVPRYYEIGARGDVLLFGDWDCDGAASPALYRPRPTEVIYVNTFAARVGDRPTPATRSPGACRAMEPPRVRRQTDGCDVVRVGPARRSSE